jgi:acid phosphatase type 7
MGSIAAIIVLVAAMVSTVEVPVSPAHARPDRSRAAVVRIAAAGDIACQPPFVVTATRCRQGATAKLIERRGAAAVIPLGDTQYEDGRLADYRRSYDRSWGAFKRRSYPVVGNHEYHQPRASGYFAYFGARAHGAPGWYAYNLGAWRLYALNSNCEHVDCTREVGWIRADIRQHPRRCSLASMHHPRFSSGAHGNSSDAKRLWPALSAAHVDVALAGHDHDYERFAPRTAAGTLSSRGIRSWVVGTGGKELARFHDIEVGSQVRWRSKPGVLFLTLHPRWYAWQYRTIDGVVRDRGTGHCVA